MNDQKRQNEIDRARKMAEEWANPSPPVFRPVPKPISKKKLAKIAKEAKI